MILANSQHSFQFWNDQFWLLFLSVRLQTIKTRVTICLLRKKERKKRKKEKERRERKEREEQRKQETVLRLGQQNTVRDELKENTSPQRNKGKIEKKIITLFLCIAWDGNSRKRPNP